jgi:hypothetical protein
MLLEIPGTIVMSSPVFLTSYYLEMKLLLDGEMLSCSYQFLFYFVGVSKEGNIFYRSFYAPALLLLVSAFL